MVSVKLDLLFYLSHYEQYFLLVVWESAHLDPNRQSLCSLQWLFCGLCKFVLEVIVKLKLVSSDNWDRHAARWIVKGVHADCLSHYNRKILHLWLFTEMVPCSIAGKGKPGDIHTSISRSARYSWISLSQILISEETASTISTAVWGSLIASIFDSRGYLFLISYVTRSFTHPMIFLRNSGVALSW